MSNFLSDFSLILRIIANSIMFLNMLFDTKIDETRRNEAKRFLFLTTKLEMSLTCLILYIAKHRRRILDFSSKILGMKIKKEEINELVDDTLSIFPIPEIPELDEEDIFSLGLNLVTKSVRETIFRVNLIAKNLETNKSDISSLSKLTVELSIMGLMDSLFNEYKILTELQFKGLRYILGKKINEKEVTKFTTKNLQHLKEMCKAEQQAFDEFNKKCSEIEDKIKAILE